MIPKIAPIDSVGAKIPPGKPAAMIPMVAIICIIKIMNNVLIKALLPGIINMGIASNAEIPFDK